MNCPPRKTVRSLLQSLDKAVAVQKDANNPLRVNVMEIGDSVVLQLLTRLDVSPLDNYGIEISTSLKNKLKSALKRYKKNESKDPKIVRNIVSTDVVPLSIATKDILDAVQGESQKYKKYNLDQPQGLPNVPLPRLAASIGRKIAYKSGFRFANTASNSQTYKASPSEIEGMYYVLGMAAIKRLENVGAITLHKNAPTVKDYVTDKELDVTFPEIGVITAEVPSLSLNKEYFGIKDTAYFTDLDSDSIAGTPFGAVVDLLKAANYVLQPTHYRVPDTSAAKNYDYTAVDARNIQPDPISHEAREKLYKKPLTVNAGAHKFLQLLHKEVERSGDNASTILNRIFKNRPLLYQNLFGIKNHNRVSVDKQSSVAGQNLSVTAPLNDLAEYYSTLTTDKGDPAELHLALKQGRNVRFYYVPSVLNPHSSKISRALLENPKETVEPVAVGSDEYSHILYEIHERLGKTFSSQDIVNGTSPTLEKALEVYNNNYLKAETLTASVAALGHIGKAIPGVTFANLITALEAVNDIRSPDADGNVKTSLAVTADATASGGTLTFLQAVGTNPNVQKFLQNIGLLKDEKGNVTTKVADLYQLMSDAITNFLEGKDDLELMPSDLDVVDSGKKDLLRDTVDLLFDQGSRLRDLSKSPTMTFVYGQGRAGAIQSITEDVANTIIDNIDSPETKLYLEKLLGKATMKSLAAKGVKDLKRVKGLYIAIKQALQTPEDDNLPSLLYDLLDVHIKQKYLEDYQKRSKKVYALIEKYTKGSVFKIMPFGAVLSKQPMSKLHTYGMPISKLYDTLEHSRTNLAKVLTRKEKKVKTVLDVSPIHGIDAGLLYHAINNVDLKHNVVVVHDEVRGHPADVKKVIDEYIKLTQTALATYDIHEQVLKALPMYDPSVFNDDEYDALLTEINDATQLKEKLAKQQFNATTNALIGNTDKVAAFVEGLEIKPAKVKKKAKKKAPTAKEVLTELSQTSELIKKFVDVFDTAIRKGKSFKYNPQKDTIIVAKNFANTEEAKVALEHEIVHAATVAEIHKALNGKADRHTMRDVQYLRHAITTLKGKDILGFSEKVAERVDYILYQPNEIQQIAEFTAIMLAEPEIAKEIYQKLGKNAKKGLIQKFVERVKLKIKQLTAKDLEKDLNVEKLYGALQRTLEAGIEARVKNQEDTVQYLKQVREVYGYKPAKNDTFKVDYINRAVSRLLVSRLEAKGASLVGTIHSNLYDTYPLYTEMVDKVRNVYDSSKTLQQVVHTITNANVDLKKKADTLAKYADVTAQRQDLISKSLNEFTHLAKSLSEPQQETLRRLVTQTPLHDYFVLAKELRTPEQINDDVTKLKKKYKSSVTALTDVEHLVNLNVHDQITGQIYSLEDKYQSHSTDTEFYMDLRKLLALRSIQEIGVKEFTELLQQTALMQKVEDHAVANYLSLLKIDGLRTLRDTAIAHRSEALMQTRAITKDDLKMYENGEETGWEVITKPTDDTLGLVAREVIDQTSLDGAFTDIKLSTADIEVPKSYSKFSNVVKTQKGMKMILTSEQRKALGMDQNFYSPLVRSTAHAMAIQESQVIRDAMLKDETRFVVTPNNVNDLVDIIKADNKDNPWFLKLQDITYNELPTSVKAVYATVGNKASDVRNFNKEVDFVRKDISHWLLGGNAKSLASNPKAQWAIRITKHLIAGSKIGMVVLNPLKIAKDNMSNLAYLGVMGVDPIFIVKNYNDIMSNYADYAEIKRKLLQIKVQLVAKPESTKLKQRYKALEKQLKKNPVGDLQEKGFINSLGSMLITKNEEAVGNMQRDVDTALKFLLKTKDGKNNYVSHLIMRMQKIGFDGEDFLKYIGGIVGKAKAGKEVEEELNQVRERIQQIKTDKEVEAYVAQFLNTPQSEAVRFGAVLTDLTDVLAKETYYRYLVNEEDMSPEKARLKVLDSFPNYTENLPMAIQQASDLGVLMFPSFWVRIQRIIYRMAKERPVSLATEEMFDAVTATNIQSIVDANVISKANSFGGLIHSPFETIGVGSFLPTHLF